jgi:hypothetical protein
MNPNAPAAPPADPGLSELLQSPEGRAYLERAAGQFREQNRAAAAPLPGPLREAFAGSPPTVLINGKTVPLQPVSLGLNAALTFINSPLLEVVRIMREEFTRPAVAPETQNPDPTPEDVAAAKFARIQAAEERIAAEIKVAPEQIAETVYCFLHTSSELRALMDRGARQFREAAMVELGDVLHPVEMGQLQQAVAAHYAASFGTVVNHEKGGQAGSAGEVFTPPPAARMTASAGGSASLAS